MAKFAGSSPVSRRYCRVDDTVGMAVLALTMYAMVGMRMVQFVVGSGKTQPNQGRMRQRQFHRYLVISLNSSSGPRAPRDIGPNDRLLYRMQLLRDVEASSAVLDHFYDAAQVALRPLQPLDDLRVALMKVDVFQPILLSIRRGYSISDAVINSLSFRRSRGSARP